MLTFALVLTWAFIVDMGLGLCPVNGAPLVVITVSLALKGTGPYTLLYVWSACGPLLGNLFTLRLP